MGKLMKNKSTGNYKNAEMQQNGILKNAEMRQNEGVKNAERKMPKNFLKMFQV